MPACLSKVVKGPAFFHKKEAEAQLAKGTAKLTPAVY
jgi:hypothetical protein